MPRSANVCPRNRVRYMGFRNLVGGHETCKGVAALDRSVPTITGLSRRGNVPPHMRLQVVLYDAASLGVHDPEIGLRLGHPLVRRQAIPPDRLRVILRHADAVGVPQPEVVLHAGIPLLGLRP